MLAVFLVILKPPQF